MVRRYVTAVVLALLAGLVLAPPPVASAMAGYKWKYRPLVVFAPDAEGAGVVVQRHMVRELRPAFIDRRIVVVYVIGDKVTSELGPRQRLGASELRSKFGVERDEFRVLLVGKDGGVKLSADTPIAGLQLFETIDAMPKRRGETKGH